MNIRYSTWALLPAEIVLIFFVLIYHHPQPDPNKPREKINIGMYPWRVEEVMGRKADGTIRGTGSRIDFWQQPEGKIIVDYCCAGRVRSLDVVPTKKQKEEAP